MKKEKTVKRTKMITGREPDLIEFRTFYEESVKLCEMAQRLFPDPAVEVIQRHANIIKQVSLALHTKTLIYDYRRSEHHDRAPGQ